jgi:transcriptional regulator with XRE-family HTH domain|tara:strand:+ start:6478 stop:6948 length:471 start_codon:yes stop_codon:yes gene_type:complete
MYRFLTLKISHLVRRKSTLALTINSCLGYLSIRDKIKLRQSQYLKNYRNETSLAFNNPLPLRLRNARQRANISQKELGIRIGMEPSSASGRMNHYEKGRHFPDLHTLNRIAKELNVPLNYFFCESEEMAEIVCLVNKLEFNKLPELIKYIEGIVIK